MSPFMKNVEIRRAVLQVMQHGGYYAYIMNAGEELDRVKQFLCLMEGGEEQVLLSFQNPTFLPIFPGVESKPFHDREDDHVAKYLERAVPEILNDALSVRGKVLTHDGGVVTQGEWQIYPLWYMGVDLTFMSSQVPKIKNIIDNMPRTGKLYPFSEALLSWQRPGTHLAKHCSVDALRLRYSVALSVKDYCEIRVAGIKKQWVNGEAIIFEDCFEHETWNGSKDRLVFIIDTWHPDISEIECEALLAGFRKQEVRKIIYEFRIKDVLRKYMLMKFEEEDGDQIIKKYWNNQPVDIPVINDWGTWTTVPIFNSATV